MSEFFSVIHTGTILRKVMNVVPVSTSCTNDIKSSIILLRTMMGLLLGRGLDSKLTGNMGLLFRYAYTDARDCALGLLRYEASECTHSCILLAI